MGISTEDDYQALSAGLGVALEFNDDHTTVDAGVAVSGDTVEAEDAAIYNDRPKKKREQLFVVRWGNGSVESCLHDTDGVRREDADGYLTDAYKRVISSI